MSDPTAQTLEIVRKLAAKVRNLERGQARLAKAARRADHSSVNGGGGIIIYEPDVPIAPGGTFHPGTGSPTAPPNAPIIQIGTGEDGTHGIVTSGGTPPATPSTPLVAKVPNGVTITWDGYDDTPAQGWSAQLAFVSVRLSAIPTDPDAVEVARLPATSGNDYGGAVTIAQPNDITTYVTLVAVLTSGVESDPSTEVTIVGGGILTTNTGVGGATNGSVDPGVDTYTGAPTLKIHPGDIPGALSSEPSIVMWAGASASDPPPSGGAAPMGAQMDLHVPFGQLTLGDLDTTVVVEGFLAGPMFEPTQDFITGGNMSVTSTAADVPGLTRTIASPEAAAIFLVRFNGWLVAGAPTYTLWVQLVVNGTVRPGICVEGGGSGSRSMEWRVTGLTGSSNVIKMQAATAAPGQTGVLAGSPNCNMVTERKG